MGLKDTPKDTQVCCCPGKKQNQRALRWLSRKTVRWRAAQTPHPSLHHWHPGFRNSFPKITSFPSTSKKIKIFWKGNRAPLVSSSWWLKELLLCWPGFAATIWGKLGCTWVTLKHVRNWRSLRSAEPSQRMAHFLQSLMSSNSHHLIQQTLQWADFNTRVSPCSHINRDLEVCNGCDKIFGYIDVMYFFLSICKQDPNLFISSSFYLEDGGKEGCLKVAFKLWYRMKPGWLLRQMIIVMCRGDCFISQ